MPEAQLDRFMFNLWLDYPNFEEEIEIVQSTTSLITHKIEKVLDSKQIIMFQDLVRLVPVADNVIEFAVRLVRATRPNSEVSKYIKDYISYGAGPRASQYLILGAKASAVLDGRYSPEIEDIRKVALPVLRHRLVTNFNAEAENVTTADIVKLLLRDFN